MRLNINFVGAPPLFFISDRAGLVYDFQYSKVVDVQDNPYLQDGEVTGSTGGTVSGLGGG